jgi:hypothetical protein
VLIRDQAQIGLPMVSNPQVTEWPSSLYSTLSPVSTLTALRRQINVCLGNALTTRLRTALDAACTTSSNANA